MKIENHLESYKEHRETIFDWALKVKGLKNSQRVIGLHASRGIVDLLMVYLLKKSIIDSGTMINHRWFKSKSVIERLPEFENKEEICNEIKKTMCHPHINVWVCDRHLFFGCSGMPHTKVCGFNIPDIIKLEILCEDLTYGAPKPEQKIKEAILIFNKLEEKLKNEEE